MAKTSKANTIIFILLAIVIIAGMIWGGLKYNHTELVVFKDSEVILALDPLQNQEVVVNSEQIVLITQDGITSYDLKGEEIWSDTLNLNAIQVKQKEPYIVVSESNARELIVFSDTGRQGKVVTQNPILYYSVNANGDIAVIERVEGEGYRVSAYDKKGNFIRGRMNYTESGSYPIAAEISPDSDMMIISYINTSGTKIISMLAALPLDTAEIQGKDVLLYGIEEEDNIITDILFINDTMWLAIGDRYITAYNKEGEQIQREEDIYLARIPYLVSVPKFGKYIPLLVNDSEAMHTIHNQQTLYMLKESGELIEEIVFNSPITYLYSDSKGVVVAENRVYKGYNKMGVQYFEYRATHDIEKVVPVKNIAVAISKDKVFLLKP